MLAVGKLAFVLMVMWLVATACGGSDNDAASGTGSSGSGQPQPSPTVALDDNEGDGFDLGLVEIVREFVLFLYGGETLSDDYEPSTYAKLDSTDPAIKRRGEFELEVRVELGSRLADDLYYGQLWQSVTDNWFACLQDYGFPPLEEIGLLSEQQQNDLEEELGMVGERGQEIENDCWKQSRIYAGKDDETDRLLELQHQYYLSAAQEWVKANPGSLVPLPE